MDTKTSLKLPRELFAQIKSNLLRQAFILQMVFESSSFHPSVVGRGGLFAELKTFGRAGKFFLLQFVRLVTLRPRGSQQVREQDPGAAPSKCQGGGISVFPCTHLISILQTKDQELRVGLPGWMRREHCAARLRCLGCNIFRELPVKMPGQAGGAGRHGRAGRGQLSVCRSPVPGSLSFIS